MGIALGGLLRKNCNEGKCLVGGHQPDRLFALFPLQKAEKYWILQNSGADAQCSQPLTLRTHRASGSAFWQTSAATS